MGETSPGGIPKEWSEVTQRPRLEGAIRKMRPGSENPPSPLNFELEKSTGDPERDAKIVAHRRESHELGLRIRGVKKMPDSDPRKLAAIEEVKKEVAQANRGALTNPKDWWTDEDLARFEKQNEEAS